MDDQARIENEKREKKPYSKLCLCTAMPFLWGLVTMFKAYKNGISADDPTRYFEKKEAGKLGNKLELSWAEQSRSKRPSLIKAIWAAFGIRFMVEGIIMAFWQIGVSVIQPLLLKSLLENYALEQTEEVKQKGYMYAAMNVGLLFFRALGSHAVMLDSTLLGIQIQTACASLVYRKLLSFNTTTVNKFTTGKIINVFSNDVKILELSFRILHYTWISPLEVIFTTYVLDQLFGHVALVGVVVVLLLIPLQVYSSKIIATFRMKVAQKTDYRVRLMNQIVCGIQLVKMYTWEKPFVSLIAEARESELDLIASSTIAKLLIFSSKIYVGRLALFALMLTSILSYVPLRAEYIFAAAIYYELVKTSMTMYLPIAVRDLSETYTSLKRLEQFLLCDWEDNQKRLDLKRSLTLTKNKTNISSLKFTSTETTVTIGIFLKNVMLKWNPDSPIYSLYNITLQAVPKELIAIVGAAGSGKSTLLQVIINELDIQGGIRTVGGTMSYASQEPWIFSASVRQNIIFDQDFDLERYRKVLKVCALEHDLVLFPYGDQSGVGERGLMLSGGQKARINLARTIYKDADIYLLDDPLSAVDAHVSKQIFNECIVDYLRDKCVVLATHQLQYLPYVHRIYLLDGGKMAASGRFNELSSLDYFEKLCADSPEKTEEAKGSDKEEVDVNDSNGALPAQTKESDLKNSNSWKTLGEYCVAGGLWLGILGVMNTFCLTQIVGTGIDYLVTILVNLDQQRQNNLTTINSKIDEFLTRENSSIVYGASIFLLLVLCSFRIWTFLKFFLNASKKLHDAMLGKVIRATMDFFNANPTGRILNRFSNDIGNTDERFSIVMFDAIQMIINFVGIAIYISTLNHLMIIPSIVLFLLCTFFCTVYLRISKEMTSNVAICRSPVLSYLASSVRGLTTIKVMGAANALEEQFDSHQDTYNSALHFQHICIMTFCFWIDVMSVAYVGLIICLFSLSDTGDFVGNFGVSIMQSMTMVGMLPYCLKNFAETACHFISVERMIEYSKLESEPDSAVIVPPDEWPKAGNLDFKSVSLKYSEEDHYALKQIEFGIKDGEKVGIIGRTGAGKSSLLGVLFRLYPFEGHIFLDGIDTKDIPLNLLRSKIAIIPQDPFLFSGTLRKNLDPFDQYSDHQIWTSLEEVELKKMVLELSAGLDSMITEGGSNISVGQKQLLCLARAILQSSTIIVLDEATANVDLMTDELIQKTIKKRFRNSTVLTIAHRIHTIMDSDKILVMANGAVVEFGHPKELLQNPNGSFSGYVSEYGIDVEQYDKKSQ